MFGIRTTAVGMVLAQCVDVKDKVAHRAQTRLMGNIFQRAEALSEAAEDWPWIWALREPAALDWKDRGKDVAEIQLVKSQQCLPVEVAPGLLLASAKEARSLATLEAFSVTHVLIAAGPLQRGPVDEYAARGCVTTPATSIALPRSTFSHSLLGSPVQVAVFA